MHAEIDTELYIEIPDRYNKIINTNDKTDLVFKLNKALYGLKQSPRLWYNYLRDNL